MYSKQQFRDAAKKFFQENPDQFKKYASLSLIDTVVAAMQLPSAVSARISFTRLVQDGTLTRTDGGDENTDRAQAAERARATIRKIEEQVASQPLSRDDYEYFIGLSPRQLSDLYFGADGSAVSEFAVKYRAAMAQWGFQEPLRYNDTPAAPSWSAGLV